MAEAMSREALAARDASDPLAHLRAHFALPEGVIYLDGNSLGPLMVGVRERVRQVVEREWGEGLIRSWNNADWIGLAQRVGGKIAPLIGAAADEVIVADSTSINLFKLLVAALRLRPGRRVILSERGNFPTDLYVAEGMARLRDSECQLRSVERTAIEAALDQSVAVLMLTEVDYRTGERHDVARLTQLAHDAGALVLWDLSHSVGALPIDLTRAHADLAVGCGYKYLNGGPGAPAFLFVARRWHAEIEPVITGWMGHVRPFAFDTSFAPAPGLARLLSGTPPVIALSALDAALDGFEGVTMRAVREKSVALSELFIALVEAQCSEFGFTLASPRVSEHRGSQVSFRHVNGYPIMQALVERGVIGDFRAPDIMRFGFAPLYLRFVDVWDSASALRDVVASGVWREARFARVATVT